jgi:hypothetical protein
MQYDSQKLWNLIMDFGDAMHARGLYLSDKKIHQEKEALSEKLREEILKICFGTKQHEN